MSETNGGAPLSVGIPPALVEAIADEVAKRLADRVPAGQPEPFMNVDDAASYLACPRSRIYDLCRGNPPRLKPHRDGSRLLFRREDLDGVVVESEDAE